MTTVRRTAVALGLVASLAFLVPAPSGAAPQWAPAATAAIHPGVQTRTKGGQCTADFVFYDASNVYIGQAAHCSSTGTSLDTDGCASESYPLGTPVTVGGASHQATLVYNSWIAMQARGEKDPDTCQYNDLALVRLDPADAGRVNPSIPHWGGPVGLNTTGTAPLDSVYSYGNSELRLGLTPLGPKKGISFGDDGGGWSHLVMTVTPGIPGDSGSAFLDAQGRALGVLSTLGIGLPGGVNNGVDDLARELDYMRANSDLSSVELAVGTVPFNGNQLPLALGLGLLGL